MAATPFLNNAATVLVVAPIAVTLAQRLGYSPDAFLMAVAIGAGSDFLTPIGHQCNTLVMGPGGYRFSDYPRLGLPLSIVAPFDAAHPLFTKVAPFVLANSTKAGTIDLLMNAGPTHDERSWNFELDPGGRDPVLGIERLQEAYFRRFPGYSRGITVPLLPD